MGWDGRGNETTRKAGGRGIQIRDGHVGHDVNINGWGCGAPPTNDQKIPRIERLNMSGRTTAERIRESCADPDILLRASVSCLSGSGISN